MRQFANGIDDRLLIPARAPQKSYSQQETFNEDVTDEEYVEAVLRRMADKLFAAVREERRSVRTLTVKVRYNDRDENQRAESLCEPTDLETDVYGRLRGLLREAWQRRVSLRMVSLKLSNVYGGVFHGELPLETNEKNHAARERLAVVLDELRRNKGWSVVLRGHDLRLRDAPRVPVTGDVRRRALIENLPSASLPRRLQSVGCYVPLRVRSHYTFLDSTLSPTAIANLAKQHGLPAIALTDLGNLHGAVEFAEAAKKAGIKPIFGTELQVGEHPLLLYVESAHGYHNLNQLLSRKAEGGMPNEETAVAARQRAPVAEAFLRQHVGLLDGLLAVSSDVRLTELFPGRFYRLGWRQASPPAVEPGILPGGQSARLQTRAWSCPSRDNISTLFPGGRMPPSTAGEDARRYATVASPAIHYALPGDRLKYDIVQSVRTRTLLRQEHPEKGAGGRLHFRTPAEMTAACKEHPEWLAHSGV